MDHSGDDNNTKRCLCCNSHVKRDCSGFFNNINVCGLQDAVAGTNSESPLVRLKAVSGSLT